jgi:hypothetical protein
MARPDMSAYFRAQIDYHVNGMLAQTHGTLPPGVLHVVGDVTTAEITVQLVSGEIYRWSGGRYSTRKVNLCYAPLMPKVIR